jgi:uncharacterized protein (DUF1697 family)
MDSIRYAAFLRAINVGGHGIIKMQDLRRAFESAGCRAVRTYIASGNVLFESPESDTVAITQAVSMQLKRSLGSDAGVLLRTLPDLEKLVKRNPYATQMPDGETKRYVSFLFSAPRLKPAVPLMSPKNDYAILKLGKAELFWTSHRVAGSYGAPDVEKLLGVSVTTRNWNTVCRMVALPP